MPICRSSRADWRQSVPRLPAVSRVLSKQIRGPLFAVYSTSILLMCFICMVAMPALAQTPPTRSAGEVIEDNAIAAKIKSALIADAQVKGTQIGIEVFQGRVQLSGFVDNADNAQKAGIIARSVEGVTEVRNNIKVK